MFILLRNLKANRGAWNKGSESTPHLVIASAASSSGNPILTKNQFCRPYVTSHVRNPVKKAQKSTENTVDKLHKLALQLPSPKDKNNNSCNVLKNGKYHNYGQVRKTISFLTEKNKCNV